MHTRWGHYTPCLVDEDEFSVTRVTHPLVTLHVLTLPVLVRVGGVTHEPQQRALEHKTIHAFGLHNLRWTVAGKIFFHRQPTCLVRHGPIQNLRAKENPPGVWGNLGDG